MPYAVWIELAGLVGLDDDACAGIPGLILRLIESGWEVPESDTDPAGTGVSEVLDVTVVGFRDGALVGVAVNTESAEEAIRAGTALARHLSGAAPALLGWTLEKLHAERLNEPADAGQWLPSLVTSGSPRSPVAAHLSFDVLALASQYLVAGAALGLLDPTRRNRHTIDTEDLIAGTVAEHPWYRAIPDALEELLVAAARRETQRVATPRRVIGRGGGDRDLAQRLLDTFRADITSPSTGYDDDDGMRGNVLIERFMSDNDLMWDRVDTSASHDADQARRDRQLRLLLWAGIRALATMSHDVDIEDSTPWTFLSDLDGSEIDPVVDTFAARDRQRLLYAGAQADDELYAATEAHLLVRAALVRPEVLANPTVRASLRDPAVTAGALQQVACETLLALGADALGAAAATAERAEVADTAARVRGALADIEAQPDDAEHDYLGDIYDILADLLADEDAPPRERERDATTVLETIRLAAQAAGQQRAAAIARGLLTRPALVAGVFANQLSDFDIEHRCRLRILAGAAAVDPGLVGEVAADLPALRSHDPRDKPALHSDVTSWWRRTIAVLANSSRNSEHPFRDEGHCPKPGVTLLRALPDADGLDIIEAMDTATAVVAVVQAISALSIMARDRTLPVEILTDLVEA